VVKGGWTSHGHGRDTRTDAEGEESCGQQGFRGRSHPGSGVWGRSHQCERSERGCRGAKPPATRFATSVSYLY